LRYKEGQVNVCKSSVKIWICTLWMNSETVADCEITFKFGHFLDFQVEDGCCFLGRDHTWKFIGRSEADLSSRNPSSICMTKR
jgi:hypothetical protein